MSAERILENQTEIIKSGRVGYRSGQLRLHKSIRSFVHRIQPPRSIGSRIKVIARLRLKITPSLFDVPWFSGAGLVQAGWELAAGVRWDDSPDIWMTVAIRVGASRI